MQLKSIGTVDFLLRLVVTLGQLESPIEDAFLHAFQFVAFTDDAIVHLLDDTRHRGEVFRLDIGDVAHDGAEILHIIGRVAEIEVCEQHRALVDVRQRQETHHLVRTGNRIMRSIVGHTTHQVVMRQHDTLGGTQRA